MVSFAISKLVSTRSGSSLKLILVTLVGHFDLWPVWRYVLSLAKGQRTQNAFDKA
jgi:hypothetical protein